MSKKVRVPQKPKEYSPRGFVQEPDWKGPKIKACTIKKHIKHRLSIYDELD